MIRTIRLPVYLMVAFVSLSFLLTGCVTTRTEPKPNDPVANVPIMKVGDKWTKEKENKIYHQKIVAVEEDGSFILEESNSTYYYYNNKFQLVKTKNLLTGKTTVKKKPLRTFISFPLFVGKKWKTKYTSTSVWGRVYDYEDIYKVTKYETIETKAGSFSAFKVKRANYLAHSPGDSGPWFSYYWYSPEVKSIVKYKSLYQKEEKLPKLISYDLVKSNEQLQANQTIDSNKKADNYANQSPKVEKVKNKPVNRPPQLIITEPFISQAGQKNELKTEQKEIKVAGRAVDEGGVYEVVINGVEAELKQDGYFSAKVPLALGENTIKIIARDNQKLTAQEKITINRLAPVPQPIIKEKRLALIIGNAEYMEGGSLTNPINDARAIASKLKKLNFEVMRKENTTQRSMKKAIDQFGRKLANFDVGLFFYAGHGVQVDGVNYLVPVNANLSSKNDVEYDCVNAGRVLAKMEDAGSKTNIMILDACRDNPFERSWTRSTKGNGLAFMNAPSGSLIAYATSPGKTASDGTDKHGLYTQALLENLSVPNITILEMFQRVRVKVMQASDNQQTPWESTSLSGNFYFKPLMN